MLKFFKQKWGDWKGGTGHRETIKIVGTDIARLDNARPYGKGGHRETWRRGARSKTAQLTMISDRGCGQHILCSQKVSCYYYCYYYYHHHHYQNHRYYYYPTATKKPHAINEMLNAVNTTAFYTW